jgi:hypothetical protein
MKGCIAAFGICFVMARVGGMRGMVRVCNIRFRVRNYAVRHAGAAGPCAPITCLSRRRARELHHTSCDMQLKHTVV